MEFLKILIIQSLTVRDLSLNRIALANIRSVNKPKYKLK